MRMAVPLTRSSAAVCRAGVLKSGRRLCCLRQRVRAVGGTSRARRKRRGHHVLWQPRWCGGRRRRHRAATPASLAPASPPTVAVTVVARDDRTVALDTAHTNQSATRRRHTHEVRLLPFSLKVFPRPGRSLRGARGGSRWRSDRQHRHELRSARRVARRRIAAARRRRRRADLVRRPHKAVHPCYLVVPPPRQLRRGEESLVKPHHFHLGGLVRRPSILATSTTSVATLGVRAGGPCTWRRRDDDTAHTTVYLCLLLQERPTRHAVTPHLRRFVRRLGPAIAVVVVLGAVFLMLVAAAAAAIAATAVVQPSQWTRLLPRLPLWRRRLAVFLSH